MPKVSVIIPNYNHSNYLYQRIESVLNQSYQDFELIILDDFSTDNSREVIEEYRGHPKISAIIYNESNSGSTFKQWEKGISLAVGEFIWIAESDDWCERSLLEELVKGLEMDENCVLSYCQSYCIQNENIISWVSQSPYLSEIMDGDLFLKNLMIRNNTIFNSSMAIWKRACFVNMSKDFTNYKFCGDWFFWMELAGMGKVHISGRVLNYFRKHDKDVSGAVNKSGVNFIETLNLFNSFYKRNLISKKDYLKAYKIQYNAYYKVRKSLPGNNRIAVLKLFKHPLDSKRTYHKIILSNLWKRLRQK